MEELAGFVIVTLTEPVGKTTVTVSVEDLPVVPVSFVAVTVAVLLMDAGAFPATVTVSVRVVAAAPAFTADASVHVTVCPEAAQFHDPPDAGTWLPLAAET